MVFKATANNFINIFGLHLLIVHLFVLFISCIKIIMKKKQQFENVLSKLSPVLLNC